VFHNLWVAVAFETVGENVVKWEYMKDHAMGIAGIIPNANRHGAKGWELTSTLPDPDNDGYFWLFFKRRIPKPRAER